MEKKNNKKIVKNLTMFGGAVLLTGALATGGLALYDNGIDHSEEVCVLTKIFGVDHQISQIQDEKNWFIPVYNDEQTFHYENTYMTGTETVTYTAYIEEEVEVPRYDENGNIVGTNKEYRLIPINAEKEKPTYGIYERDITVTADDSEMKLYDKFTGAIKTLKLN